MISVLKGLQNAQSASNTTNPYAVDVIKAKRRDLIYGISHTEELLDLLVTEGAMTAAKRSIVLTIRTREEQNSRVLDILVARGERACRKFFHPCLMLAEPRLYQRIKAYVGSVNESIGDTRRQLIGYLLERDELEMSKMTDQTAFQKTYNSLTTKERKTQKEDGCTVPISKSETLKAAQKNPEKLFSVIASGGELSGVKELLNNIDTDTVNSSSETLLHVAAEHGRLSVIKLLLHKGARLDLQDSNGHTALHRAASRGHTEVVRALIKVGAPIYTLDTLGQTPIHLAAKNEQLNTVRALVKEETGHSQNKTQDSFLHMAAKEDNWRLAELLLQSGAAVNTRNQLKKSALFCAVTGGNERTVTVLLNAGAEFDQGVINEAIKLNHGSILHLLLAHAGGGVSAEALGSALFSAVRQNQDKVVSALIDSGADVNMQDKQGYTSLLLSTELGHTETFRALAAKQAKLDATLPNLLSALHLAVQSGSVPIVQALLDKGLHPSTAGPKAHTPLHLAAHHNRPQLSGLLLKAGAQVNAVDQDGLTPLHIASQQGHAETVIQLLQGGADPGAQDRLGRTALHWAASAQGQNPAVDLLLSARANPNTTDREKKTALHLAATQGNTHAVTSLLSHKVKGGTKDMDGSTPLHHAAACGHAAVVTALLHSLKNKGLEVRNVWRKTPLHAAAERGHDSVVELLLDAGANINAKDNSKDTPLHCAARGGHHEVVRRLVGRGQTGSLGRGKRANLQATNNVGKTPLQVAERGDTVGHEDIASFLKRKMFLIK
ncbi:CARD- and ANK-domain containing inflammasome adapter protein [Myripristis murdjan]|uniref:CARD- and ANK-domain containing inflammasome adapter protein n=1 Tax=Myripristis murdjan TaxID=586833 RepID=UPI001175F6FC|nr:ankyrin-1-like [Myripristis murdjan]